MIYAYIDRSGKLCIKPMSPDAEEDLREWLEKFKRTPHEYIDVETQMDENQYQHYRQNQQRYGYGQKGGQQFGFQPSSYYMPMPPDFSPQSHFPLWPFVLPYILEGRGGDGGYGRGGYRSDQQGGEYDGGGSRTPPENPADTGRRDRTRR
jgi:hypothetical protein